MKAQRLKTLTEDVVEASKVSSGNIKLEFMTLNLVELIYQVEGEYEEKFEARNIKVILNMPDEPVTVRVDGRRMWRVFANIFNNAAKYAMEGSRVYADLMLQPGTAKFILKNVSDQQLNISADELTERFIRGDVSRSTEGSGLGLSIAKNLTELQGGTFELYLDGDLFKVIITFPRVRRLIKEQTPKKKTRKRSRRQNRKKQIKNKEIFRFRRGYFDILSLRFGGIRITIIQEKVERKFQMEELRAYLEQVFCIELLSAVLSNPRDREKAFKGRIRPVLKKGNLVYQFEIFKGKQVFHENLEAKAAVDRACEWMEHFRQMQIDTKSERASVLISKKGKVTINRKR